MRRAFIAAAAAAAFAGCGGDDGANDYVSSVNRAQAGLTQRFTELQSRISNVSEPKRDARVLREYETAVEQAVAALRAVDPPGEVASLHRELVDHTGAYGTAIEQARGALAGGVATEVLRAQTELTTAITETTSRINDTTAKINQALRE